MHKSNNPEHHTSVTSFLEMMNTMVMDISQVSFDKLLERPVLCRVMAIWWEFLDHLRHDHGELSAFWMSYVDMVEGVVLGLLRASREGNRNLHLHSLRMMITWCFAYDKVNYARYFTVYFAQMTNLVENIPEVHRAFTSGSFSV